MTRLLLSTFFLALFAATPVVAQDGLASESDRTDTMSSGQIVITPEMWFYLQEQKKVDDPATLVQRNAAMRAEQRRNRIAAMRWYGMSAQRPMASPTPFMGTYSPYWSAMPGTGYQWSTGGIILATPGATSGSR